jgi:hypothetical protein
VLIAGLSADMLDEHNLRTPNQGMWRSARNGMLIALGVGLVFGLGVGLAFGLLYGLAFGLGAGLLYGWHACIQHILLRLLLWRSGAIPADYVGFLDYAAERILLRKVGGGYQFIHRMLLEYFAGLEPEGDADGATGHRTPQT